MKSVWRKQGACAAQDSSICFGHLHILLGSQARYCLLCSFYCLVSILKYIAVTCGWTNRLSFIKNIQVFYFLYVLLKTASIYLFIYLLSIFFFFCFAFLYIFSFFSNAHMWCRNSSNDLDVWALSIIVSAIGYDMIFFFIFNIIYGMYIELQEYFTS